MCACVCVKEGERAGERAWLEWGWETHEADIKSGFNLPLGCMIQSAGTGLGDSLCLSPVCVRACVRALVRACQ